MSDTPDAAPAAAKAPALSETDILQGDILTLQLRMRAVVKQRDAANDAHAKAEGEILLRDIRIKQFDKQLADAMALVGNLQARVAELTPPAPAAPSTEQN